MLFDKCLWVDEVDEDDDDDENWRQWKKVLENKNERV